MTIVVGTLVEVTAGPLKGKQGYAGDRQNVGASDEAYAVTFGLLPVGHDRAWLNPNRVWILATMLKKVAPA